MGMKFFQIENGSVIDARRLQMDEHVSNFHSCARISTSSKQNLKSLTRLEPRALSTEQVHGNEVLPDREWVSD